MAMSMCEEYGALEVADSGDERTATLKFQLKGVTDRLAAELYLVTQSPATYDGLFKSSYTLQQVPTVTGGLYKGEVNYKSKQPENLVGKVISFRSSSQTVKRLYAPVVSYRGEVDPSVMNGAINMDESGTPTGADVEIPLVHMDYVTTTAKNSVYIEDVNRWSSMVKKVNSDVWGVFPVGSVRCDDFNYTGGNAQKDVTQFAFTIAPQETITILGGPLVKRGHDYLQIGVRKTFNATEKLVGARVIFAATHQTYDYAAFGGAFKYLNNTVNIIVPPTSW